MHQVGQLIRKIKMLNLIGKIKISILILKLMNKCISTVYVIAKLNINQEKNKNYVLDSKIKKCIDLYKKIFLFIESL